MKLCDTAEEVLAKSSRYESSYMWLSKDRVIFLKEGIDKNVAAELSALLLYYDNESHDDIYLYIHSNGGDGDGLINIYDVVHMIKSPLHTICLGKAFSAAAILLAAGSKGNRYAFKNSKIMIHGVQFVFPIPGDDQVSSKNYFEYVKRNNNNFMKMLASDTGQPLKKVMEDCKRDLFLDAKDALKYGIVDHII